MNTAALSKPGTLVRARGREWVVLPESTDKLLMVRPLGGLDQEIVGILPKIESVESAAFSLPTRNDLGDFSSGRLLRDAARLSTRAAAGPFRSFARIAVNPHPYQLVPLMMALKLDPVRMLIADDVGIGKTIEAALVARELIDRGEISRLAVLCPPHLAEQWQKELSEKFHIDAELVLSSTIQRLERNLPVGVSVFDRHPFLIVSIDFIKSDRRADDFVLKCPELVIVDEAHGCTVTGGARRGRQQRYNLLKKIAKKPDQHLLLVTATPHSGNEQAFRSLLGLLDDTFIDLPSDLESKEREGIRRKLARHLVQRRRADITQYLDTNTPFPKRLDKEVTYAFNPEYRVLFDDMVNFACELINDTEGSDRRRRVRYWSALALLRCVSSSPAAAVATLKARTELDNHSDDELDEVGSKSVLDQDDVDEVTVVDLSPGADSEEAAEHTRRKLLAFARRAEAFFGASDSKLQTAVVQIKSLIKEGFQPIVFCRFIDTAEYVAKELRSALPDTIEVECITGQLPPAERENRIETLVKKGGDYVLVCTNCLSEGINLQEGFNAVFHYDICWNPTLHEQREGRVDRFGQREPVVRVATYYGADNPIDGVILKVLLRKHKSIKSDLGVTVAVPDSGDQITRTLIEGALFRIKTGGVQDQLEFTFDETVNKAVKTMETKWENAREKERAIRSRFAQNPLDEDTVAKELKSVQEAIGSNEDVERFFCTLLPAAKVAVKEDNKAVTVTINEETPRSLRQAMGTEQSFTGRFHLPLQKGERYLGRTAPIVEGLASWALDQALDSDAQDTRAVAARCGVIRTAAVKTRTTLLLARFRYHLQFSRKQEKTLLCEEILPLACTGSPDKDLRWLDVEESEALLTASPDDGLIRTAIDQQLDWLLPALPRFQEALIAIAEGRAEKQLEAHGRVRSASKMTGTIRIKPVLPVDILGAYVLLSRL